MNPISSAAGAPPVLRRDQTAALAAGIVGAVFVPGDDGYTEECAVYNLNHPLAPALVVGAAGAADVQAAVRFAAEHGLHVAVKTTGHQMVLPGLGAVLVDTRRMGGASVDAGNRTARVEAGVLWQQVIEEAGRFGLAPASGSMPDVGVVGYTLGGGVGPVLGRTVGYAADHVRAIDVVTADGELRRVTAESEPDLFWAMRGCKGNFGMVTAMEFDLFPVSRFYGGGLYFSGERVADVLHAWREWVAGIPEEMSSSVAVQRLPPLPELPDPLRGAFVVHLRISHLGTAAEAEQLIAPMRAVAPAVFDTLGEMPATAMRMIHNDPTEPMPYSDRTVSLRELSKEAVDALVEAVGPDSGCPLASVEIRSLGGAFDRQPAVPNAVATRGVPFVVFGFGVGGGDQVDFMKDRLAGLVATLAPWSDDRLMANFLSADEATTPEQMKAVFGADRYDRLTAVKKAYDPSNMFRVNHNIAAVG